MSGDFHARGARGIELKVRVALSNDQLTEVTLFPLASHQHESPIDMLYGFLNKRRGSFFPARNADQQDMLLQLGNCLMFEISNEAIEQLKRQGTVTSRAAIHGDEKGVVAYAAVVITLTTGRSVRGDIWFYDFDQLEDRTVAAKLNEEARYLLVHGERTKIFVRRDSILKVTLRSALQGEDSGVSHPQHVRECCGLSDLSGQAARRNSSSSEIVSRYEQEGTPLPSHVERSRMILDTPVHAAARQGSSTAVKSFPFAPRSGDAFRKPDSKDLQPRPTTPQPSESDEDTFPAS